MSDTEGVKMVAKIFKESTLKKVLQNIIDDYSYYFFFFLKANRDFGTTDMTQLLYHYKFGLSGEVGSMSAYACIKKDIIVEARFSLNCEELCSSCTHDGFYKLILSIYSAE